MVKIEYLLEAQSFPEDKNAIDKTNRFRRFLNKQQGFSLRSAKLKFQPLDYIVHYNLDLINESNDLTTFQLVLYTKQENASFIHRLNTVSENLQNIFLNDLEDSQYILYVTKTYDEISKSLCIQGYTLIYEIENSLRKIIAKSLYLNYGNKWFENIGYFPNIQLKNIDKSKNGKIINPLEAVDLDQLRIIIFKETTLIADSKIADHLSDLSSPKEVIDTLKEKFIPLSNWDRIMNQIFTDVTKEQLQKNLKDLNENFRRLIAHNRTFTYKEYEKLKKSYDFLKKILDIALKNLFETIELDENEEIEIEKIENSINEAV